MQMTETEIELLQLFINK